VERVRPGGSLAASANVDHTRNDKSPVHAAYSHRGAAYASRARKSITLYHHESRADFTLALVDSLA